MSLFSMGEYLTVETYLGFIAFVAAFFIVGKILTWSVRLAFRVATILFGLAALTLTLAMAWKLFAA